MASKLEEFSQEQHKKYVKEAIAEGVVAILPLIAILFGLTVILQQPNTAELLSPGRIGIGVFAFPVILIGYLVFLVFVIKDIRKRVRQH